MHEIDQANYQQCGLKMSSTSSSEFSKKGRYSEAC